jgi:hypothetical protein
VVGFVNQPNRLIQASFLSDSIHPPAAHVRLVLAPSTLKDRQFVALSMSPVPQPRLYTRTCSRGSAVTLHAHQVHVQGAVQVQQQ